MLPSAFGKWSSWRSSKCFERDCAFRDLWILHLWILNLWILNLWILNLWILIMSGQDSSSSSSGDYARFAGNTRIRELGCYVDLNGSFYEVPRLDVEQNLRWELVAQSVDVIYPHGVRGSNRMVVDVMSYKQRRGRRTVSPFIC